MSATFADLIAQPYTHRVTLAEIVAGERLYFTAQVSGNAYSLSGYLYETINLTDGRQSKIPKVITAMIADGVSLAAQTSLAAVEANNNSFWHDTANQILYVNTGGGGGTATPPLTVTMMAWFTLYFGSEGKSFNGNYYEAYISSAPAISLANQNLLSGYITIGNGTITFANADGFFDAIADKYIWENNAVKILIGGGDAGYPYGEFQTAFVGKVVNKSWSLDAFSLVLRDYIQDVLRQIPEQAFTTAVYPHMNPNMAGKPIPIAYGTFDIYSAPDVVAIDESAGSAGVRFKIAQHEITAITGVYVSQDNGNTYSAAYTLSGTAFPGNPAEGAGYFNQCLNGATPAEIVVAISGYDDKKTKVKVAFGGKPTAPASGVVMANPSNVVRDILTAYNYFTTANLNAAAFNNSAAASGASLNFYLDAPARAADIITKICNSDLAFFFVDRSGLLNYVAWQPSNVASITNVFDEKTIFSLAADFSAQDHFTTIQAGYGWNAKDGYKYTAAVNTENINVYRQRQQKIVDTWLTALADASTLAFRLGQIHKKPFETLKIKASWAAGQLNIGDKLLISLNRAPASAGNFTNQIFEVMSVVKDFIAGSVDLVIANWNESGLEVGWFCAAGAPPWASSTPAQKSAQGYWCDVNGFADGAGADITSKNVSLWW